MEYFSRNLLRCALCILTFAAACHAEKAYLVIQVADIYDQPVAGLELATKGSSESGTSDRHGRTRLKLDPQIKVNDWLAIQIVKSPAGKDLVLISPWDAHAQVPPFENETTNYLPVVVTKRSDVALLKNGKALTAIAAQINKANSPKSKDHDSNQQRGESLETIAKKFGLVPEDVDKAIRAWGDHTDDPYEKGLAALYEKNYPLASQELSQSLDLREKELVKAQAATADAAFFLGQSRYQEGKYGESVNSYKKALLLRPDDSTTMNNLGLSMQHAGDYSGAEPFLRRALMISEKVLGPEDPDVGTTLNNLAFLLKVKGDYTAAEPLYRRALAIAEKVLGPDHPDVGRDLNNLAELLRAKGDYAEAEPLYRRALSIDEKALGPNHPIVATVLNNMAVLLVEKGNYAAAEPLYRHALAIDERALGPDHPDVGRDLNNLGALLEEKGDYSAAELLLRRALALDEKVLGPTHPRITPDLSNLALLLRKRGDYAGAELLYRRVLAIDEKVLGEDHPDVSRDLTILALLLQKKGEYMEAEKLLSRALAVDEKAFGQDHPNTRALRGKLSALLEEKEKASKPK